MSYYNQNQPPVGVPPPKAAMKKGRLKFSGRKPLGGVSNSENPFPKKASEKMVRKKNFAVIKDENGARVKKNISKAFGTRKVLADISNSIRHQTSRKKRNTEKSIADEEYDPHDHEACRKAQECDAMDMDDFFPICRPKELPSVERLDSPPPRTPQCFLEEIPEVSIWDRAPYHSPPVSPDDYQYWKDIDPNFKLIDSPKLAKLLDLQHLKMLEMYFDTNV